MKKLLDEGLPKNEIAKLQALVGAVQARLNAKTDSERIEAAKQVRIAESEAIESVMKARAPVDIAQAKAAAEIARAEAPVKEAEAEAAVKIIKTIAAAQSQQEMIKSAATVASLGILSVTE